MSSGNIDFLIQKRIDRFQSRRFICNCDKNDQEHKYFPIVCKIAHTMQMALQKIISVQEKKNFEQWRF